MVIDVATHYTHNTQAQLSKIGVVYIRVHTHGQLTAGKHAHIDNINYYHSMQPDSQSLPLSVTQAQRDTDRYGT